MSKKITEPSQIPYTKSRLESSAQAPIFVIKQQFLKLVGTHIRIYDHNKHLVIKAYGKPFKLREEIQMFSDDAMQYKVMTSSTPKIIDFNVTFNIVDQKNNVIGYVERKGWSSEFVRDSWIVRRADNSVVATLKEDNVKVALVRRFIFGLIPQRHTIKTTSGQELKLIQSWNPVTLRYKVYCTDYEAFTQELSEQLLLGLLGTIITIEGHQR